MHITVLSPRDVVANPLVSCKLNCRKRINCKNTSISKALVNKTGVILTVKDIENYLEKEKVDVLLATAKAYNFRDYLMLRILWRTGMRISELLTIRPQDLEAHNQVINITKAKGNKQRRVMLDTETFAMLSDYISNSDIPVSRPVFAFSSVWAWKLVKKYARMAGLPDTIHLHTLRHSYAVRMVRSGTDLRSVQLLLGHANLSTTQVYLQFKDEDLRAIYNAVEF